MFRFLFRYSLKQLGLAGLALILSGVMAIAGPQQLLDRCTE